MKNKKDVFLTILLGLSMLCMLIICNFSFAIADNWYNDYTYTLDDKNNNIVLTKYNGDETNIEVPSDVVISEKSYNVIISGDVYSNNKTIKTITFHDGVTAGEDLTKLFYNCSELESVEFNDFNTENVTSMDNMFSFCRKLKGLDLSVFDTSNVSNMRRMFAECSALKSLNVSGFDTSALVNMEGMFYGVSKLEELDLSSFNTKKVTNMMDIFNGFLSIKKITLGPKTDLKTTVLSNAGNFSRGTWKRVSDGKIFTTVKIGVESSSANGAAGTYIKQSNISSELGIDFPVTYKIEKISKISKINTTDDGVFYQQGNKIYATVPLTQNSLYEIPGSADILFEDVVSDENNNKYNLKLTISNIKLYDLSTYGTLKEAKIEVVSIIGNSITFTHNFINPNTDSVIYVNNNSVSRIQDVTIEIVDDKGNKMPGNFIFSAYDIDYPSSRDESGYGNYSEGINFISGFDLNNLKLASLSFLQTSTTTNNYKRVTGTRADNSSESSEFLIKANAGGSKFQWTAGLTCSSMILSYYQPKIVEIEKIDASGKSLSNVELALYKGNEIFTKWITSEGNKKIFLTPGKYTLKEVKWPDNYQKAEDIEFFVDINDTLTIDGKNVNKITMIDKYAESGGIVEKHIDEFTGTVLEQKKHSGLINDEYKTESKVFEGYKLISAPTNQNGIMEKNVKEVKYYYRKFYNIITKVLGTGGDIKGDETVLEGEDSTPNLIVATPNKNYIIEKIMVNGEEIPITDKYKMTLNNFENVMKDMIVEVSFVEYIDNVPSTDKTNQLIILSTICGILGFGILVIAKHSKVKVIN